MRRDLETLVRGLLDGGAQLVVRVLDGLRVGAVRQERSRREKLDQVHAVLRDVPHTLAHLIHAVRNSKLQVPGQLDVGSEAAGHRPASSRDREIRTRDVHVGTREIALRDRVAQGDVHEGAIGADVTHRREAGLERHAGVGNRLEGALGRRRLQLREGIGVARSRRRGACGNR